MRPPLFALIMHLTPIFAAFTLPTLQESLPCLQLCDNKAADLANAPLCAIDPPQSSENDLTNTISCLCTDRNLLIAVIPCVLRSCAANSSSIETYFTHLYTLCHTHGHTHYPSPPHLLKALGIFVPPNTTLPTTISGIPENSAFPEVAGTTRYAALPTQHFINRLAAEAAPTEHGSVEGTASGTARVEVGMGVAGAGMVGVAGVGVVVLVVLVVF